MYKEMEAGDLNKVLQDDATKWAEAFCEFFPDNHVGYEMMFVWFANAIETGFTYRVGKLKEEGFTIVPNEPTEATINNIKIYTKRDEGNAYLAYKTVVEAAKEDG